MGYSRLFVTIQFYFCSISKIMIAWCYDDVPLMDRGLLPLASRDGEGVDVGSPLRSGGRFDSFGDGNNAGQNQSDSQNQSNDFLHSFLSPYFFCPILGDMYIIPAFQEIVKRFLNKLWTFCKYTYFYYKT